MQTAIGQDVRVAAVDMPHSSSGTRHSKWAMAQFYVQPDYKSVKVKDRPLYDPFIDPFTVPWTPQTSISHDGVDAAQSGAISNSEES